MTDLEDRILAHIGLYQISFAHVVEKLFFDGQSCGRVMNQLREQNRVQIRRGFQDGPKYYQLTRSELRRRKLPEWRCKRPKPQAFSMATAILWFCNMSKNVRHLLEVEEISELFPQGLPDGTHCIEQTEDSHRIVRIRVASSETDPKYSCLIASLRKRVAEAIRFPGLRPWVTSGRYAFAVLTENDAEARAVREIINADDLIPSLAIVVVEQSPAAARSAPLTATEQV